MPSIDKSFVMNHTCIRIKDPKVSVPFYEKNFGMKLLNRFDLNGFSLYMMGYPEPSGANWAAREGVLELCHNHGAESDPEYKLNNGNGEKFRGFGHICITVDNVEDCEKKLLADGVRFQKKLSDGRQLNIAFALDPDGYWVEFFAHGVNKKDATDTSTYRFNHTMIRVRDPKKSLDFYLNVLGMKLFRKHDFEAAKFSLYFLGYDHDHDFAAGELTREIQSSKQGIIELTHNWGTENDDSFEGYHNGNSTENGAVQGYGHTCVSCDDPAAFCKEIEEEFGEKITWSTKWNQGGMKNLAFIKDPDGYSVEIIPGNMFHDWVDGKPPQ